MPDAVRYRPRWRQLPWFLVLVVAPSTIRLMAADRPGAEKVVVVAVVALVLAAALAEGWAMGVLLRPDALVVCGLRRRVIPWRQVHGFDVTTMFGVTRGVSVRTPSASYRLRAPTHTPVIAPDREFAAKVEAIREYWLAATSAGSAP